MSAKQRDKRLALLGKLVKRDNVRLETIARRIGVTYRTIYNWIDGRSGVSPLASPLLDKFLAEYESEITAQRSSDIAALTGAGMRIETALEDGSIDDREDRDIRRSLQTVRNKTGKAESKLDDFRRRRGRG